MNFLNILLQAPATPPPGADPNAQNPGGGLIQMLVMFGLIFVVFYFFMIRPQSKKTKDEQTFRESLKKGDKVMTIGGIHGRIVSIEDNYIFIEVDNNVKLKMEKSAIRPAAPDEPAK